MRISSIIALSFVAAFAATSAMAKDKAVVGKIVKFECGDNCYLTIKPKTGDDINALCSVDLCVPWSEEQAMPPKYVGKRVKAVLGTGHQYDGAGNEMGEFPEIKMLTLVKK